jgi:subtilase family serine protease
MRRGRGMTQLLAGCTLLATVLALTAASGTRPTRDAGRSGLAAAVSVFPQVRLGTLPRAGSLPGGYTPAQIRAAYFLNPLLSAGVDGKGQSIVIVDSFGSPTIAHDLAVFDQRFNLPAPPSLLIIHPAGPIPPFRQTSTRLSWAAETTLDVEWAHVMAPAARIVLVETPVSENEGTSGFPQIVTSEKYVIAHHLGGVISQSFGATEETFPKGTLRPLRGAYLAAANPANKVTVVSASGDAGATDFKSNLSSLYTMPVTSWPASDPLVTSVGGLDLRLNGLGQRTAPDRVWNDGGAAAGGGGKSVIFGRPAFQGAEAAIVGAHRGVPDVSLSASCSHAVDIFSSFGGAAWQTICGTSEATPIFAGIIALADQVAGHPLGPINGYLYQMAAAHDPGIVDITQGTNTVTFQQNGKTYTVHGWNAVSGYDLSSGLGTINARWFVRELAALAAKHH